MKKHKAENIPTDLSRIHDHIQHQQHSRLQSIQMRLQHVEIRSQNHNRKPPRPTLPSVFPRARIPLLHSILYLPEDVLALAQHVFRRQERLLRAQFGLAVLLQGLAQLVEDAAGERDVGCETLRGVICVFDLAVERAQLDGELHAQLGQLQTAGDDPDDFNPGHGGSGSIDRVVWECRGMGGGNGGYQVVVGIQVRAAGQCMAA